MSKRVTPPPEYRLPSQAAIDAHLERLTHRAIAIQNAKPNTHANCHRCGYIFPATSAVSLYVHALSCPSLFQRRNFDGRLPTGNTR